MFDQYSKILLMGLGQDFNFKEFDTLIKLCTWNTLILP